MIVLLDLSAAFDTINHDNLFRIIEKYTIVNIICDNALKLFYVIFHKSYSPCSNRYCFL